MADIDKVLQSKTPTDPRTILPKHYIDLIELFNREKAGLLSLIRGKRINYTIELEKDEKGKEKKVL